MAPPSSVRYTDEFKQEAIRLYRSGTRGIEKVAREIGNAPESLKRWVRQDGIGSAKSEGPTTAEREVLKRLSRLTRRCQRERASPTPVFGRSQNGRAGEQYFW